MIEKITLDHAAQELPRFHKTFRGLSDEEAELEFIREAQKLQEYGIHFYQVQRKMPHSGGGKVDTYFVIRVLLFNPVEIKNVAFKLSAVTLETVFFLMI